MKLYYDDGAGYSKLLIANETGKSKLFTQQALVHPASQAFPSTIELPVEEEYLGIKCFFTGSDALTQGYFDVEYDVSNTRYVGDTALVRLFSVLLQSVPDSRLTRARIPVDKLVIAVNAKAAKDLSDEIRTFYEGQHEFRYRGVTYIVEIKRCVVVSQPAAAVAYLVANNPLPKHQKDRPIEKSTLLLLDIGNFTLDMVVAHSGEVIEERQHVWKFGANQLREQVSELIRSKLELKSNPPLFTAEEVLETGIISTADSEIDVSKHIQAIQQKLWNQIANKIRPRIDGLSVHYVIAVGGGALNHIYGNQIRQMTTGNGKTWGDFARFAVPRSPQEIVVRGMELL